MFILADQRKGSSEQIAENFRRYRDYLHQQRRRFPPVAHRLASSEWYFDPSDHRCPHDSWLEEVSITEAAAGERAECRTVALRLRMLDAYHRGHIEFLYDEVCNYQIALDNGGRGHGDWLYDEFRVTDEGRLIHEIEWWHAGRLERWLIEASDLVYNWRALGE